MLDMRVLHRNVLSVRVKTPKCLCQGSTRAMGLFPKEAGRLDGWQREQERVKRQFPENSNSYLGGRAGEQGTKGSSSVWNRKI